VLVRFGRLVFAELKTDGGRLSQAQREWLGALEACPVDVYTWRPKDMDRVKSILARRTVAGS
jgi:hypothetical protein